MVNLQSYATTQDVLIQNMQIKVHGLLHPALNHSLFQKGRREAEGMDSNFSRFWILTGIFSSSKCTVSTGVDLLHVGQLAIVYVARYMLHTRLELFIAIDINASQASRADFPVMNKGIRLHKYNPVLGMT